MNAAWSECTGKYEQGNRCHVEMRLHVSLNQNRDFFYNLLCSPGFSTSTSAHTHSKILFLKNFVTLEHFSLLLIFLIRSTYMAWEKLVQSSENLYQHSIRATKEGNHFDVGTSRNLITKRRRLCTVSCICRLRLWVPWSGERSFKEIQPKLLTA